MPFSSKVEIRREWKEIVEYIKSDLYKAVSRDDRMSGFLESCDQEFVSPLGWRVRLRRCDMKDGDHRMQIDAWVFYADGNVYRKQEDAHVTDFYNGRMIP